MTTKLKPMQVLQVGLLASLVAAAVVACGGGATGGSGNAPTEANRALQDLKVVLTANSTVLPDDKSTPVDLMAQVTDTNGLAKKDVAVQFKVSDDLAGTTLELTNEGKTDASGVASARLRLTGATTARDVKVYASADGKTGSELIIKVGPKASGSGPAVNNSRGELNVRLGTNNLISETQDKLSYIKEFVAVVADNAGIPMANATVLATVRPMYYYVGYYVGAAQSATTNGGWAPHYMVPQGSTDPAIKSEDVANFGVCDPGEDVNGDKALTPGNVASYTISGPTDANGMAIIRVTYPKSHANFTVVSLEATAKVGGTEGFNGLPILLPASAVDLTNSQQPPSAIRRTYGSLSTTKMPMSETGGAAALDPAAIVNGSPYPHQTITPTCP